MAGQGSVGNSAAGCITLIPSSLDSDRHVAPGRDLAGVAAVRLVFRQSTENSTAVREVSAF